MPISVPTAYIIAQDFYYKWYLCKFPFPLQKNGNLPVAAFYAQVLKRITIIIRTIRII